MEKGVKEKGERKKGWNRKREVREQDKVKNGG